MTSVIRLTRPATAKQRFEQFIRPHFDDLYSAARRMTLSPHDAEDLLQDVFIKAFAAIDELETMRYPRAWLLKVMYNQFVDLTRRDDRAPLGLAATGEDSDEPDTHAVDLDSPEEAADREQRLEQVIRAMQCLGAERCALVAMHDLEGFSIDELCKLTGLPEGTIKSQLHRTRRKIGRLLSNQSLARPRLRVVGEIS